MGPTVSQGDTYIFKYMKSARKRRYMVLQGNIIRVPDLGGWGSHSYGCFNQLRSEGWATLWRKKRERERRGDKVKSHVKLTGQIAQRSHLGATGGLVWLHHKGWGENSGKLVLEKRWRGWWSCPRPPSPIIAVVLILRSSLSLPSTHPFLELGLGFELYVERGAPQHTLGGAVTSQSVFFV